MTCVYVVVANSDHSVWNVTSFKDEERAKKFCEDTRRKGILKYAFKEKVNKIRYEMLAVWKAENPLPSRDLIPSKPKMDYPGVDAKTAQFLHLQRLDEWRPIYAQADAVFRIALDEWSNRMKAYDQECIKKAQEIIFADEAELVISQQMIEDMNVARYYVECIEVEE